MPTVEQKTTLELKLEKLRQICEKSPDHPIALLALAETAFRRGLRLEALEAYQKVLRDESVAEARLSMAQMYRHHGLYQEALNEILELFATEPCYPEAHVFAQELREKIELPGEISELLDEGCGEDELALARVRLNIARSLVLREGQELTSIHEANAGDPTYGYYIGETRKRLSYCEQVLTQLSHLEESRRQHLLEQERNRQLERERQAELEALQLQREVERRQEELAAQLALEAAEQLSTLQAIAEPVESETQPILDNRDETEAQELLHLAPHDEVPFTSEQDPETVGHEEVSELEASSEPGYGEFHSPEDESAPPLMTEPAYEAIEPPAVEPEVIPAQAPSRPPEPALWDDLPRPNLGPEVAARNFENVRDEYTLDLTPTLVGELPEPDLPEPDLPEPELPLAERVDPEPASSSGLWEDPPYHESEESGSTETLDVAPHSVQSPAQEPDPTPLELPQPEPETPVVEEPPVSDSNQRLDYPSMYQGMLSSLEGLVQTLSKTRSVSSVVLINRDGYVITEVIKDSVTPQRLSEFMVEATGFLEAFSDTPQYWVLECAGGIVVIQSVDAFHFVIAIGQSGANFGALRFTMDRVRPNFEQVLENLR